MKKTTPKITKKTLSPSLLTILKKRIAKLERAEKALQSENRFLRELYDSAPLGYQSLDENGSFIEVNRAWLDILGYSRQEVIGKNFSEFLHPDWRDHFRENFPRFKAIGEILGVEFEMVKKDGSTMLVSFNGKISKNSGGKFQHTHCIFRDITFYNQVKEQREAERRLLHICHVNTDFRDLMRELVGFFQDLTGCEAFGIRMRKGEAFPYYETRGFPEDFLMSENSLCTPDLKGDLLRDSAGNPVLECMCGNILCGRFDPVKPFFTKHGSFWTNSTSELLASTTEADRKAGTCNRCNGEGYESVALVPLRTNNKTYGLLQFNDPRKNRFTPEKIELIEHLSEHVSLAIAKHLTDEELHNSEEQYRLLFENAQEAIIITQERRMVIVNPMAVKIIGYSAKELTSRPFAEFAHADDREMVLENHLKRLRGDDASSNYNFRLLCSDGSVKWMEQHGSLITWNGKPASLNFLTDITEWKKAEESLRESEAMYRTLVTGLPDVIMRFDRECRHLFVSDNVCNVVDLQASQFIGKTHRELGFPEDQCKFWEDAIREAFDSVTPFETEYAFDSKNGPAIHNWRLIPELDESGTIQSVLSLSRDITAHRRAEQNYRMIFNEMIDGFALHEIICDSEGNPADYRFLAINPAFERMTNLKAGDILGRTVLEVLPGTERHWIETYGEVALTGKPISFENYSSDLKKYFEVTAFRHAPNQFACIFSDITERKKAVEELLGKTVALSKYNKMMVGRELKMIDLKKEINRLLQKCGEKEKFKIHEIRKIIKDQP